MIYASLLFEFWLVQSRGTPALRSLHLTRGAPGEKWRGCDFVTDDVLHQVCLHVFAFFLSVFFVCSVPCLCELFKTVLAGMKKS